MLERNNASGGGKFEDEAVIVYSSLRDERGYPVWDDGTFEPEEMEDHVAGMSADDLNGQIQMPKWEWMAAVAVVQASKTWGFGPEEHMSTIQGFIVHVTVSSRVGTGSRGREPSNYEGKLNQIGTNGRDHQKSNIARKYSSFNLIVMFACLLKLNPLDPWPLVSRHRVGTKPEG